MGSWINTALGGLNRIAGMVPGDSPEKRTVRLFGGAAFVAFCGGAVLLRRAHWGVRLGALAAATFGVYEYFEKAARAVAEWIPPAPKAKEPAIPDAFFANVESQRVGGKHVEPNGVEVTRFVAEDVTAHQALVELSQTTLAGLSLEDRAKIERCVARATTEHEAFRKSLGLTAPHAHSFYFVPKGWTPKGDLTRGIMEGLEESLFGRTVVARVVSEADGSQYISVRIDHAIKHEEAYVSQILQHELNHALLAKSEFRVKPGPDGFSITASSRSGFGVNGQRVEGDKKLGIFAGTFPKVTWRGQKTSERLLRFNEGVTEFLSWIQSKHVAKSGYRPDAMKLLEFYRLLPETQRDDFVRLLVAAQLEGNVKRVLEYFVPRTASREDRRKTHEALLDFRFNELRAPNAHAA
ncbi:MAG: hypothetical protein ACKVPX_09335 [Myxococcaceae bacterium]